MALALPSIKGATVDVTTFQGTGMDPLAVPQQLLGDARVAQYLADVANKYEWDADAQATVVVKPEQGVLHLDKASTHAETLPPLHLALLLEARCVPLSYDAPPIGSHN